MSPLEDKSAFRAGQAGRGPHALKLQAWPRLCSGEGIPLVPGLAGPAGPGPEVQGWATAGAAAPSGEGMVCSQQSQSSPLRTVCSCLSVCPAACQGNRRPSSKLAK